MPKKLLVADDSVTIQRAIAIAFAKEDFVLVTAKSGEEAIAKAREHRPDVVLADLSMPAGTGYDVCSALRADPAFGAVHILLLAAVSNPVDEARLKQVGADGHVIKPFETQGLIDRVKAVAASQRTATAAPAQQGGQQFASVIEFEAEPPGRGVAEPMPSFGAPAPGPASRPAGLPPIGGAKAPATPFQAPQKQAAPAVPQQAAPPPRQAQPAQQQQPARAQTAPPPTAARPVAPAALPQRPGSSVAQPLPQPPVPASRTAVPTSTAQRPAESLTPGRSMTMVGIGLPNLAPQSGPQRGPQPTSTAAPQAAKPAVSAAPPLQQAPAQQVAPAQPAPVQRPAAPSLAAPSASQGRTPAVAPDARGPEYELLARLSREVIERIVWEVVPELAETLIREELERVIRERNSGSGGGRG